MIVRFNLQRTACLRPPDFRGRVSGEVRRFDLLSPSIQSDEVLVDYQDVVDQLLGRIEDETIQSSGLLPKLWMGSQQASLPLHLQLATNRFVLAGKPFQAMRMRVRSVDDELQFTVNSNEVTGFFTYPISLNCLSFDMIVLLDS